MKDELANEIESDEDISMENIQEEQNMDQEEDKVLSEENEKNFKDEVKKISNVVLENKDIQSKEIKEKNIDKARKQDIELIKKGKEIDERRQNHNEFLGSLQREEEQRLASIKVRNEKRSEIEGENVEKMDDFNINIQEKKIKSPITEIKMTDLIKKAVLK